MLLRKLSVVLFCVLLAACEKDEITLSDAQDVLKPLIEEVKKGNCLCDPIINAYVYNGERVYALIYTGPACNSIVTYYGADGKQLMTFAAVNFDQFVAQATFVDTVWRCR